MNTRDSSVARSPGETWDVCPACGFLVEVDAHDTVDAFELSDVARADDAVVHFHEECYPHASDRYRLF